MRTLLTDVDCVFPHPSENRTERRTVLFSDEGVLDFDPPKTAAVDERIDGTGKVLMAGAIDDQVHFREPGLTHKEDLRTGSRACARGGVTSFFEMPNTKPATITCDALDAKLATAASKCVVDFGFFIGATPTNVAELGAARTTPGIKIFIGSSTGDLLVDQQVALERIFAETTLTITAHCEDEETVQANFAAVGRRLGDPPWPVSEHSNVRDHAAARISAARAFELSDRYSHRFHLLHTSTADEVALLRRASDLITAEACPHHLFFNLDDYDRLGTLVQMNPSIKTAADNAALWEALHDGTIDLIATDHAPHTLEEKRQPYPSSPSGLPAVENSLRLMVDQAIRGRCTLSQVTRWMSEQPARVWNVLRKGRIEVGLDADLVLIDPEATHTVRNSEQVTKCGWSPWDGRELKGDLLATWVRGSRVYDRDRGVLADEPVGRRVRFTHE